jgi:hypothetical protein
MNEVYSWLHLAAGVMRTCPSRVHGTLIGICSIYKHDSSVNLRNAYRSGGYSRNALNLYLEGARAKRLARHKVVYSVFAGYRESSNFKQSRQRDSFKIFVYFAEILRLLLVLGGGGGLRLLQRVSFYDSV